MEQRLSEEILGEYLPLTEFYYLLHSHPELSFEEFHTAEAIALRLKQEGIAVRPVAGTGVLAEIRGERPGGSVDRAVVLRADIDALPIEEQSAVRVQSLTHGVMHACGHDLHTTVLLGTLILLGRRRRDFSGRVFGLFQPGEEKNPGGATLVLSENPFEGVNISAFIGLHVEPMLPTGHFGIRKGKYMASSDELRFTLRGRGGHAALREGMRDPIAATAKLIDFLYEIPSFSPDKSLPTIVSIGRIEADGATNIVPDESRLEGTMRCFDEGWRAEIKSLIRDRAMRVEAETGVAVEVDISEGYPSVVNDSALALRAERLAAELGTVHDLPLRPTSEDFGFYTERYPSLFFRLGVGYQGDDFAAGRAGKLHTAALCPDPKAIAYGVAVEESLVLDILNSK